MLASKHPDEVRGIGVPDTLRDRIDALVGVQQQSSCLRHAPADDPLHGTAARRFRQRRGDVGGTATDGRRDLAQRQRTQAVALDEAKAVGDHAAARDARQVDARRSIDLVDDEREQAALHRFVARALGELAEQRLEERLACGRDVHDRRGTIAHALERLEQRLAIRREARHAECDAPERGPSPLDHAVRLPSRHDEDIPGIERPLAVLLDARLPIRVERERGVTVRDVSTPRRPIIPDASPRDDGRHDVAHSEGFHHIDAYHAGGVRARRATHRLARAVRDVLARSAEVPVRDEAFAHFGAAAAASARMAWSEAMLTRAHVGLFAIAIVSACSTVDGDGESDGAESGATETTDPSTSGMTTADAPASSTGGDPSSDDAPDPETGEPATTSGSPPSDCANASLFGPGMTNGIAIDVDGVERTYDLFVPTGYDPTSPAPLVLNFHGLLGSPSQQVDFSQFNGAAETHGMLVAYPAGIGASFNAGSCCGQAATDGVDDVGFARALVQDVTVKMCVDPRRVFATGMSNGGHMAHRLACEAPDVFAAAASVTGALRLAECAPSRPISMMQYHGTADTIVGYAEIPGMMEAWAARNGCGAASSTTFERGDMLCQTWPDCDGGVEVTFCTVDGGGHCWPGNGSCIFGHSSTELHASEAIATMFDAQPLP